MSHSRFTRMPRPLMAAAVVSFCAVAHAGPAETIFSAENALYGAGYDIGTADGWIDTTLRSAIREYQSSHGGLQATGNLDPQTLAALGIAAKGSDTVTGNTVANREAAMSALGISEQRYGSPSAPRTVAAAPEPEVQPEPEPVEEIEDPVPATTLAMDDSEAFQAEPELTEPAPTETAKTEPVVEPQAIAKATQEGPAETPATEQAPEQDANLTTDEVPQTAEPEPQKAQASETAPVDVAAAEEPAVIEEPVASEEPAVTLDVSSDATEETSTDVSFQASDEQNTSVDPKAQSSGGFFSSLFDFLFGWLI